MIVAINYADGKFEELRKYNSLTAYTKGKVDKVIEYSPQDIDDYFVNKNKRIFDCKRGAGLWLWKPYIILKALDSIQNGDYVFYCDAGAYYVNSVKLLVEVMELFKVEIMPFELPLLQRQWTKKEAFTIMEYNDFSHNQILAGYLLLKKSDFSVRLIREWLYYAQDERCISPSNFTKEVDFDDFVEHREDQSIFSIICRKYSVETFRDPSQYGDRPWEYAWNSAKGSQKWTYCKKRKTNSPYPRILVSNRGEDPHIFRKKEFAKNLLWRLGIYNKYYLKLVRGAFIED